MSDNEPAESAVFVKLLGVSPDDIPVDESEIPADEAQELANDIHRLITEDYAFDVDGVAPVVNPDIHQTLTDALRGDADDSGVAESR